MATPIDRALARLEQLAPTHHEMERMLDYLAGHAPDAIAHAVAFVEEERAAQPAGYRIPPPVDPAERARWEAGVARRLAAGQRYLGDGDHRPTNRP